MKWFLLPLLFLVSACSTKDAHTQRVQSWMSDSNKIKVLSTTAMIDDLVRQVGKERIESISLIYGEIDPHSYELVKGDDEKLQKARLIFCNGLGLEHGASLRGYLSKRSGVVALGDELRKKEPGSIIKVGKESDPHIWMDLFLWAKTVDFIVQALVEIDPQGKVEYENNGAALKEKMLALHASIVQRMQNIPAEKRFLVTSHDAFNYFTRAYLAVEGEQEWRKRFAAPEGIAPDGQLSVADIQAIIKHLSLYQIPVIFPESNVSRDSLKKIANACAAKGLSVKLSSEVLFADSMQESYFEMIEHNAKVLEDAWR